MRCLFSYNRLIDNRLYVCSRAHSSEVRIVARWAHPVAQEYVYHVVFRVNPEACSRKSSVPHHLGRRFIASRGICRVVHIGLVETKPPEAIRAFVGQECLNRGRLQISHSTIRPAVKPHLKQLCQVVGVRKQTSIALHSAQNGCKLYKRCRRCRGNCKAEAGFYECNLRCRRRNKSIHSFSCREAER